MAQNPIPLDVPPLTSRVHELRDRDRLSRLAQWLMLFEALSAPFGGPAALRSRGTILSFVATPADDECRCDGSDPHSKLRAVRFAQMEQLRLVQREVGRRAREDLTVAWLVLADAVFDLLPVHRHSGFVIDFESAILGAWHDWTCLPCGGGAPCLLVDLTASAPLRMAGIPASAGVPVLAPSGPGKALVVPDDPRDEPVRRVEELWDQLGKRMDRLAVGLPCDAHTEPHN